MKASRSEQLGVPTPRQIVAHLDRFVIGQQEAKRALALAGYAHLRRTQRRGETGWRKANVLMIGPTGSGKTLLARHLAGVLRVPFCVADATEYTEAGYYGKDVELMVSDLFQQAGQSTEEAQRGVIFIDEVDKLARRTQGSPGSAGARDIGGEGVQQALLKLLEGREVQVSTGGAAPWNRQEGGSSVHTGEVLFICAGTFSDLHDELRPRRTVGFGGAEAARTPRAVGLRELVSFGMLAEFLGRLPVLVQLQPLGRRELEQILVEPQDALIAELRQRLALDGVELVVRSGAVRAIAEAAQQRGVGARGLRALVERVCAELLFDAPERPGTRFVLDGPYVRRRLAAAVPA